MYNPYGGLGSPRKRPGNGESTARPNAVGPLAHYACSLIGLAVVGLTGMLFYSELIGLTRSFELLSSTAIAFALLFAWLLAWLGIEIIWEWRAGRLSASR